MSSKKTSSQHHSSDKDKLKSKKPSHDDVKTKSHRSKDKKETYNDSSLKSQKPKSRIDEKQEKYIYNEGGRAQFWAHDKLENTDDPFEDDFNDKITQPLKRK